MEIMLTVTILSIISTECIIVISSVPKITAAWQVYLAPVRLIMAHAGSDALTFMLKLNIATMYR